MQWSDVVKPPSRTHLRQFAGIFLVVFLGLAGWRWYDGQREGLTLLMAGLAAGVGLVGLIAPALLRPVYTGWMIAAFPIGWTISRVVLGTVFFLVITPMAWVFRLSGRDALSLRRPLGGTHWKSRARPAADASYFRQF